MVPDAPRRTPDRQRGDSYNGHSVKRKCKTGLPLTSLVLRWLAPALVLLATVASAADADIVAARAAWERGNVNALAKLRDRSAAHPLGAYPAFWHLLTTLDAAPEADLRAFMEANRDGPLADLLRRDWLKRLGAAGKWAEFRREHPALIADDHEVACYALQARLDSGDPEALQEARGRFVGGKEAPASCQPVFAALANERLIGSPEVWSRIRQLLAAGALAETKRANLLLANRERFDERDLALANDDPARFLARPRPKTPPNRAFHELSLHAVARLARKSPEEAATRLQDLAPTLGPDDSRYGWAEVALVSARSHHPRAVEWYRLAGEGPFSEPQLQWMVRAALRAGDWSLVRAAVNRMPPLEGRDPAWQYWLGRALRAEGANEAARAVMLPLAQERHFYGLLAAEDVGLARPPDWMPRSVPEEDVARMRAVPAVSRALALYRLGLAQEAFREWVFGLRARTDAEYLAAAELASREGLIDRSIGTADRTVTLHDFTRRYPTTHIETLSESARQWNVAEAKVFAVIRQESRFNATIRSRAGAIGLMQLMPATASWVAKQMSFPDYRIGLLDLPSVNIAMGTYYYHRVLADLGHPVLATAAYNAGPSRARRWRDAAPLEGAIYAESIPFNETRDYVKKVMANAWFYHHRLVGEVASLRAMLGTVPGRGNAEPASGSNIP